MKIKENSMWYIVVWNIIKWVFTYLPIEQVLARMFNLALGKIDSKEDFAKINLSIEHCLESTMIMSRIMSDAVVTDEEAKVLVDEVNLLRKELIAAWAKGESNKEAEDAIVALETK